MAVVSSPLKQHGATSSSNGLGKTIFRMEREDQPLRAEFLSLDQLTRHGQTLANWHQIADRPRADRLLPALAENALILRESYELANTALREGRTVVPAAEWLLDNYYIIENHVRMTRQHLPRHYSQELPQLQGGPADGRPRVYDIAMELICHADGLLDAENLGQFVSAYQKVAPLKLGELWAIPIMLRLALLENLRRIAMRIAWQQRDRDLGAYWADSVLEVQEKDPKQVIVVLAELIKSDPSISSSFVTEYIQRLQGRVGPAPIAISWLDHWLAEHGQTVERLVHLNSQTQAADQVSMGNSITSLRAVGAYDWKTFVEDQSYVERVLRSDPSGVYRRMTFSTRDRYRHAIEKIARRSPRSEIQVARVAIELAQEAHGEHLEQADDHRSAREVEPKHHIGYYLVDKGRNLLEKSVGYRRTASDTIRRIGSKFRMTFFFGGMAIIWMSMLLAAVIAADAAGIIGEVWSVGWLIPFILLALYGSQFAVSVLNWLCILLVKPRGTNQLDFSREIPIECRSMVVVPTMLISPRGVESLLEQLEVRYLANRDHNLHFALLTDFCDAEQEQLPQDELLIDLARQGIEQLNHKYIAERTDLFYLFHRPRVYNEQEGVWMGRERKRGKLGDLNKLLCGGDTKAFGIIVGNLLPLSNIRYVITLDTDTQLPRDTAHRLIGCMAHPLNRPRFDAVTGRVTKGYAILQPRVSVSIPEATRSLYSRMFAGDPGIDPYTNQVSNVYQDVFAEGSFIGKGIYDLQAFQSALHDRFPDNQVLSHDLIEGSFARSGLVTELDVFEGFPSRYLADASRRHRWVRGDWQLLGWLMPRVPHAHGKTNNPLSMLSWWKLFDNLRRSVMPPVLLLLLVTAWVMAPAAAWYWTLAALILIVLPVVLEAAPGVFRVPEEMPIGMHLKARARDFGKRLLQELFMLAVLPYEAHWHLDAVIRTLYRHFISRRKLLEWTTASDAERRAEGNLAGHYELMFASTVISVGVTTALTLWAPKALLAASPVLALWLAGPWLAWKLSQPFRVTPGRLTHQQRLSLRRFARRTWHYFDTFVTERDHWLAPDNFQEHPVGVIAPRTSPTNMGMGLMANLAAWDFGYISASQMVRRLEQTLTVMEQLDRFHQHLLNWYDTRTLQPIEPRYVSSVDSGNLVALLLTLKAGLEQLSKKPVLNGEIFQGLGDTLRIALDVARERPSGGNGAPATNALREIPERIERLLAECRTQVDTLSRAHRLLEHLAGTASDLAGVAGGTSDPRVVGWIRAFEAQCRDFNFELLRLAPWIALPLPAFEFDSAVLNGSRGQADRLRQSIESLDRDVSLFDLPQRANEIEVAIRNLYPPAAESPQPVGSDADVANDATTVDSTWSGTADWMHYATLFAQGALEATRLMQSLNSLAVRCGRMAVMDFRFLFDADRDLLTIGYNVSEQRMDNSFYDLLASEARVASFVAVSQGQLPREHWFALGRMLTAHGGDPTLLSWSGSMFEYLMPMLVMPTYEGTLLDLACRGAVNRQIQYGRQKGVPWGVSESCYNVTDTNLTYQYRAFGVPGIGFQRGLGEDVVVAPYASVMAAMVAPQEAVRNLERMEAAGFLGEYGFYDAIDYTPSRSGAGKEPVICKTFMAHHSGMSLLALDWVLRDRPMQQRFLADPLLKAHELLLQERVPNVIRPVDPHPAETPEPHSQMTPGEAADTTRAYDTADTPAPEVHLLGDGQYHVMVSNSGGGYSSWNDLAVTRWHPDATRDHCGQFCYVRDMVTGEFWSTTYQPTQRQPEKYSVFFGPGKAEFRRVDNRLVSHTSIAVSPEDDVEVRRVSLNNLSRLPRSIELTSYGEIVIAAAAADAAHRAFSNLFVTTELLPERCAILCTRRPRSKTEKPPFMFHMMICDKSRKGRISFETDRWRFIGRGRSLRDPVCMRGSILLSNTAGAVLDPIFSIRRDMQIEAEESFDIDIITGIAPTREAALALIEKYQDYRLADRVFELAWPHEQVTRRQFGASDADVKLFSQLAGPIVHGGSLYRSGSSVLSQNRRNQTHLWSYAISGDLPIVLVKVSDPSRLGIVRRMLHAHAYWRQKGLHADLVIWNDDLGGYRHQMHDELMGMVASSHDAALLDTPGGIFIRRSDQMPDEDRLLLEAVAAVVLTDTSGTLAEQVDRRPRGEVTLPAFRATRTRKAEVERDLPLPRRDLTFFNGFGGFTPDAKEYITLLRGGMATPAPWCNVIANEQFGTIVSESNLGHTWFKNAHEFRLTPWHNDPVCDPASEALYVRDEETGRFFSPTPLPARGPRSYVCRHGFGYSVWEYEETGLQTELTVYVGIDVPVKFYLLKLKNASGRRRTLSVTGYVEWILGELRTRTAPHLVTEIDPQTGAILVRNRFSIDFNSLVAFFQTSEGQRHVTCDRGEFIGRNGTLAEPAAMRQARLSGKTGAGLDPCAAMQVSLELAEGEEREVMFLLGAADDTSMAAGLLQRFKRVGDARRTLEKVWSYWSHSLSAVYVETPDQRLNALANGWLLYQTLSCRFWGRSGFYQSGGAYGFRDQLQDSLALLHASGYLTRAHLIRCAGRQFREGDVQHWWHPPTGRGVRTHFSDDYLWLPFATAHYVNVTGDTGVLDEVAHFLTDRLVGANEESFYNQSQVSDESASLYEHCKRAIQYGLKFGSHGLPLMGCGDWNDGMNRVGIDGQGESVWLAFFLYDVLKKFAPLARWREDVQFADMCIETAETLKEAIETQAWDGQWYRRAYFDDGKPLGARENAECQIDSLPQSWSVISGAGHPERAQQAMEAVHERLVCPDAKIIQLFTPPFDSGTTDPGYIKGYVPGVRENGGQYTHAAIWTTMAFALLGDNARAWECFELINPLNHSNNEASAGTYKVEPYVIAADVYSVTPQEGRGGWTWYTGSAGWMYRLITETLFGLRLESGTRLTFRPCVPSSWKRYKINYRFHNTFYRIQFIIQGEPTHNVARLTLDGAEQPGGVLPLNDDGREHQVEVVLGTI